MFKINFINEMKKVDIFGKNKCKKLLTKIRHNLK